MMKRELAETVGQALKRQQMVLTTAESCTGGWIAKCVTDIPGSSAWFDRGFVTYSNAAKEDMLGVDAAIIKQYGAVSEQTAAAMASGALVHARATVALSVTGIAGPGGGTPDKPVGTVCFGWQLADKAVITQRKLFSGDRNAVRGQSVEYSLRQLLALL